MVPLSELSRRSETSSIDAAAVRLGISRTLAYSEAKRGTLAGIPVLRISRRMVIPTAALDRLLGCADVSEDR